MLVVLFSVANLHDVLLVPVLFPTNSLQQLNAELQYLKEESPRLRVENDRLRKVCLPECPSLVKYLGSGAFVLNT